MILPRVVRCFGPTNAAKELCRIQSAGVLEDDARHMVLTQKHVMPIAKKMLGFTGIIEKCYLECDHVSDCVVLKTNFIFGELACVFEVDYIPFKKQADEHLPVTWAGLVTMVENSYRRDVELLRCIKRVRPEVMKYALKHAHAFEKLLACISDGDWRFQSTRFALFFSSLVDVFLATIDAKLRGATKEKLDSFGGYTKLLDGAGILCLAAELFVEYHTIEPAKKRVKTAWSYFQDLERAMGCSIGVLRSMRVNSIPDFEESFLPKYRLALPESVRLYVPCFVWHANDDKADTERSFPCATESCKGLFDSKTGRCASCSVVFCVDCHQPRTDGHVCLPENELSIEDIKNTTTACPRCSFAVYKTSGCDQMMCTSCKCLFLFSTGKLVEKNSALHNPYYLALPLEEREAVRSSILDASSTLETEFDFACLQLHEPNWEIVFMNCVARLDDMAFRKILNKEMRFWVLYKINLIDEAKDTANDERIDRISRVQHMLGVTLPKPIDWNRSKVLFTKPEPFTLGQYIRRLRSSAAVRKRKQKALIIKQDACDVAKQLLTLYANEHNSARRERLFGALLNFKHSFLTSGTKRKRENE